MIKHTKLGAYILIKVIPQERANEIIGWENERLKIRLAAIPEKGQANAKLIQFLAQILCIPKSQIILVQRETSRLKKVFIKNPLPKEYENLIALKRWGEII